MSNDWKIHNTLMDSHLFKQTTVIQLLCDNDTQKKRDIMSKCAPSEMARSTLYFSLLFLCVTVNANCPKWWLISDFLLQSKAVREPV